MYKNQGPTTVTQNKAREYLRSFPTGPEVPNLRHEIGPNTGRRRIWNHFINHVATEHNYRFCMARGGTRVATFEYGPYDTSWNKTLLHISHTLTHMIYKNTHTDLIMHKHTSRDSSSRNQKAYKYPCVDADRTPSNKTQATTSSTTPNKTGTLRPPPHDRFCETRMRLDICSTAPTGVTNTY